MKLNDKLIKEICEARELKMTIGEICELYNIARSTVYRALKKAKITTTTESTIAITPAENINVVVASIESNLYPVGNGARIKCGLVKDRHDLPTKLYIFNSALDEQLMFNYKAQLEICERFINDNIKFNENGDACQDIVCYVTGLQCALAAFIKACRDKKVNLILRHYNSRFTKYAYQSIWNDFGETYPEYMASLIGQASAVYTYNNRLSEIDTKHLYTVCVVVYDDNAPITTIYICGSLSDAYRINYTVVEDLMYKYTGEYQVYLDERTLNSKESGYISERILKTCNN